MRARQTERGEATVATKSESCVALICGARER